VTTPGPSLSVEVPAYIRKKRWILKNAYVDAVAGEITALVGMSGAGKTTIMEIMVGERRCPDAYVRFDGTTLDKPRFESLSAGGVFFQPDFSWLHPSLTVAQHLALAARQGGADWRGLAAEYGIDHLLGSNTKALSGGETRLTGLLIALLACRRVLVADEPWRGLDPKTRAAVARMLRVIADRGVAVLIADHDAQAILRCADRIFAIENGRTRYVMDFRATPIDRWYRAWPLNV
jgi:ABC-type multidrug transport system ATPase subunit